jgi:hypothetical protein
MMDGIRLFRGGAHAHATIIGWFFAGMQGIQGIRKGEEDSNDERR